MDDNNNKTNDLQKQFESKVAELQSLPDISKVQIISRFLFRHGFFMQKPKSQNDMYAIKIDGQGRPTIQVVTDFLIERRNRTDEEIEMLVRMYKLINIILNSTKTVQLSPDNIKIRYKVVGR